MTCGYLELVTRNRALINSRTNTVFLLVSLFPVCSSFYLSKFYQWKPVKTKKQKILEKTYIQPWTLKRYSFGQKLRNIKLPITITDYQPRASDNRPNKREHQNDTANCKHLARLCGPVCIWSISILISNSLVGHGKGVTRLYGTFEKQVNFINIVSNNKFEIGTFSNSLDIFFAHRFSNLNLKQIQKTSLKL